MSSSNKRSAETSLEQERESSRPRMYPILEENDTYNDCDDDESTEYEKQTNTLWKTPRETYNAHIQITKDSDHKRLRRINASLLLDKKSVGTLTGAILQRPSPDFYETADSISEEFEWISSLFCDSDGITDRIKTDLGEHGVQSGGFFHIDEVVIEA